MKYNVILFFILIILSIVVNFNMPAKIIDQINMLSVVGYDKAGESKIEGTVVTPVYRQDGQLEDLTYTNTGSTIYEVADKLNTESSEELFHGKMEIVLYNVGIAEQGLKDYIDYLLRDPSIGARLHIAIIQDSASNLLTSLKSKKGAGIYLTELIEQNIERGNIPTSNLKTFSEQKTSKTQDANLPLLINKNGTPSIIGLALFDDDKYVERISLDQASLFKLLYENVTSGKYNYENEKFKASVRQIESKRHITVEKPENGRYKITLKVNMEGTVREYTGKEDKDYLSKLEKAVQKDANQRAKQLVSQFQEWEIDPLDIGGHVRSQVRDFNIKQFKKSYPDLSIEVDITVDLLETGTRR